MFETDDDDGPATSRSPASMPIPEIAMVAGGATIPKQLMKEWFAATEDCNQKVFAYAELRMRHDTAARALEAAQSRRAHICAAVNHWMETQSPITPETSK